MQPRGYRWPRGYRGRYHAGSTSGPLLYYSQGTFTRTSEAAYVDPRDGWSFQAQGGGAWLPANTPRIFSDGAVLIEGERQNTARRSPDLSYGAWGKYNSTTVESIEGPDGNIGPYRVVPDASIPSTGYLVMDTTVASGADYRACVSAYVRGPNGDRPHAWNYLDTASANAAVPMTAPGVWERKSVALTDCDGRLGISNGGGGTDPVDYFLPQLEPSEDFPTSPIRCFGAATTRATEVLTFPEASLPSDFYTGKWEFDFWPLFSSDEIIDGTSGYMNLIAWGPVTRAAGFAFYKTTDRWQFGLLRDNGGIAGTVLSLNGASFNRLDKITVSVDFAAKTWGLAGMGPVDAQDMVWTEHATVPTIGGAVTIGNRYSGNNATNAVISQPRRVS